ncbi:flagellar biosynthetic protein FliQ [Roseomonas stagni]|uniref:Flagellar biosynthetic protein FliQ n=1 Tax=Falsiroseomonas algicola TaxID=2716930 RepID=A0A6M1LER6_9PROT|nr:flagellar biosynthetic protein FliQ [Falsiroseomonas algicola]NGM18788.1 flagellar biosynthetic protein FliQ [Falsiroseomonas algicola]
MVEEAMAQSLREAIWVSMQVMGPPLVAVLVVGLAVSLVQALTQVQEATLAFLPKLIMGGALMLLLGPFTASVMQGWSGTLFDRMVALGGMP